MLFSCKDNGISHPRFMNAKIEWRTESGGNSVAFIGHDAMYQILPNHYSDYESGTFSTNTPNLLPLQNPSSKLKQWCDKPLMKKGPLLLGYARLSKTDDQDNVAQVKMLRHAGCKRIFEEPNRFSPLAVRVNHVGLAILRVPVGRGPNALHYVSRTRGSNLLA